LDFADSLIRFKPEAHLDERFSSVPLLIAHGAENELHPVTEPKSLFTAYPDPKQQTPLCARQRLKCLHWPVIRTPMYLDLSVIMPIPHLYTPGCIAGPIPGEPPFSANAAYWFSRVSMVPTTKP